MSDDAMGDFFLGTTIIVGVIAAVGWVACYCANKIPKREKVQEGYVVPNKLEIELDDMDRNGEEEVILKYDGKPYLFMVDKQGKPVVLPYEIMFDNDYFKFEVKPLEEK